MVRYLLLLFLLHIGKGIEEGQCGVTFPACGQVQCGLCQVEASLRQSDAVKGGGTGSDDVYRIGVGKAHVLGGRNEHPAEDETGILSGCDHAGKPVEGGIGIAAPE